MTSRTPSSSFNFSGKVAISCEETFAQEDRPIVGALRVSTLHQETLDLAGPETKRLSKQFGREISVLDLNSKLATLIS